MRKCQLQSGVIFRQPSSPFRIASGHLYKRPWAHLLLRLTAAEESSDLGGDGVGLFDSFINSAVNVSVAASDSDLRENVLIHVILDQQLVFAVGGDHLHGGDEQLVLYLPCRLCLDPLVDGRIAAVVVVGESS